VRENNSIATEDVEITTSQKWFELSRLRKKILLLWSAIDLIEIGTATPL
jgi:hypothetical protein